MLKLKANALCCALSQRKDFESREDETRNRHLTAGLTGVRVCGTHHNHRGADASSLPQAQAVVLLLGKHWNLVIHVVHINDHLQENKEQGARVRA